MRERLARFMQGRYGADTFGKFLFGCALVCIVLEWFIPVRSARIILDSWGILLLLYAYFRMFSKNHYRRYAENERFMKYYNRFLVWKNRQKSRVKDRKMHRIFKCPGCKQSIRVPKGKGRIAITCPKCRTEFIKRT